MSFEHLNTKKIRDIFRGGPHYTCFEEVTSQKKCGMRGVQKRAAKHVKKSDEMDKYRRFYGIFEGSGCGLLH